MSKVRFPTNTPRVFHVETTWKRSFPPRFNVEYTSCVCRGDIVGALLPRHRTQIERATQV